MKMPAFLRCRFGIVLVVLFGARGADAQLPPDHALVVKGGLLWGGGLDRDLKFRPGDGSDKVVWQGTPFYVARTTGRIVFATSEGLSLLDPADWKETTQAVEQRIVALATSADTVLAFDAARQVWRWQEGGKWTMQASGLGKYESVAALAFGKGVWVAAGSDRWGERTDSNGEELHPPATWYPSSRIWWSADGKKWNSVVLPGEEDGGSQRIETLAAGAAGFLAITTGAEVLFSGDGKLWRSGVWPKEAEPGTFILHQLAGAFWLLIKDTHGLSRSLYRTADGTKWEQQPVTAGASLAALMIKDGQVQALGYRKQGRALEVAAVADFAVVPAPNAAELAAAKAAAEKARAEAEAKRLAEQRVAAAKAKAENDAAAAKAAVEKQAVAKREAAARERARVYANLKQDVTRQSLVLSHLRLLNQFTAAHGQLTQAEADELVPLLLKNFSGAKAYLLSISSSDELMRSILRRLTPEQKAAMQEVAKAAGSRTSLGQPVRAPVIDLSQITSASTALFDVAYMEPRASYRATSDTSYIGAAYDMALAYAEGAGVKQDANRARSHMHLADREGIRPLPASGTGGSAVLKGPGGVDLFAAARYGSTVAANLYANELLKQGKSTPAIEWLRAAALKTHYNSRSTLASYVLIEGDLRAGTIEEAFRWLEAGARAGQPNSVGLLGYAILHGLGVEPDPTAARPYLEAGARLGSQSTKKILDSLNAWEKDRAAAWDAIAQASKQSNEIFDRVGKATAKYAQDLRAANESLGIGKEASGDAAALARTRAELKAKGMTEAQIDAHLAQVNKDLAPAQTARPPGPPASPPAEPPKR